MEKSAPQWEVNYVTTYEGLEQAITECLQEDIVALDTETADWQVNREQNEYLCLIQLGLPAKQKTFIVDALAFTGGDRNLEKEKLAPFRRLFENEQHPKFLIQYARFEAGQFQRSGIFIKYNRILDTWAIARSVLPGLPSYALKKMYAAFFKKEIGDWESLQTSDWAVRPLSREQLEYAALDVEYVWDILKYLELEAERKGINIDEVDWQPMKRKNYGR
jgi:ribonuclease D